MFFGLPFGFQIFSGVLPFLNTGNVALQATQNLQHKEWYKMFSKEAIQYYLKCAEFYNFLSRVSRLLCTNNK